MTFPVKLVPGECCSEGNHLVEIGLPWELIPFSPALTNWPLLSEVR